jgi:hypothetical protein
MSRCYGCNMQWSHYYCANSQSRGNWTTDLWQFAQKTRWLVLAVRAMVGMSQPSQRNVPRDFVQQATVGEVEVESKQNLPNLENQFLR